MDKKIKILFAINKLTIGGAENIAVNLANLINKDEYDAYFGIMYRTIKKANFYSKLRLSEARIIHFDFHYFFDIKAFFRVYRFLKQEKIKIVVTHLFEANTAVRLAAILARVPIIIIYEHSVYFAKKYWQRKVDWFLALFTDKIIGVAQGVIDFTSQQEKISKDKFQLIKQICDLSVGNIDQRNKIRMSLGIKDNTLVVINLGRFSPEKNQPFIIKLADFLVNKLGELDIVFLIVGYGKMEEELKEKINQAGLQSYVYLLVDPINAKDYLVAGDVFLLPSKREGQPIAMLEAMATGLPALATDVGGIKEIIKDGQSGFLIDDNIDKIANHILFLKKNPDKRKIMGQAAKECAWQSVGKIIEFEFLINNLYKSKKLN